MKTGVATVPLDYGKCPKWLFERMKRLSGGIMLAITEEFGPEEILEKGIKNSKISLREKQKAFDRLKKI